METAPPNPSHPPGSALLAHLRHKMGAGLLIVVPFGITLFVLRFLFNLADGILAPYLRQAVRLAGGRDIYLPGLGMAVGFVTVYLAGLLATNVFGRRLVARWESFLSRIPVIKSIFLAAKQVVEVFSRRKAETSFRQAVFVDFPRPGSFSPAYVTNEVTAASGKRYLFCFVPTIPNPTTGFVLLVEESRVYPSGMTIEEAMKVVMSCGVVTPESLRGDGLH